MNAEADQTANDRAVYPNVLEVWADIVLELLDNRLRVPTLNGLGDQSPDVPPMATRNFSQQGTKTTVYRFEDRRVFK